MTHGKLSWQGNRRKAMSSKVYDFFFQPDFSTIDMAVLLTLFMSFEFWTAFVSGAVWVIFSCLFLMGRYVDKEDK